MWWDFLIHILNYTCQVRWENKSILCVPCHYSNQHYPHTSVSKSYELKSVWSNPFHYPLSNYKQSFVLNQNDSKSNLKDLSWKLSLSHKEFSVSKPKNVSKSINRQKENTKNNKNNFSVYLIQQFHLWVQKQCLVPYSSNFWKKENNCTGYFICQAGSRKITPQLKLLDISFKLEKQMIVLMKHWKLKIRLR